ncbi:MAG: oligosaccharide flippase family protein [Paludibacteraceae bacterium]|nr:oligosaccharide flippase family protein [Paludibacteraceae bacterium]
MSDNKRIAKNTIFLYFRMILIMGVSLFTSRVILDKLGVVDYGLYNVVGGVVGMLSFLNGTLSNGTSRFLTYELGADNKEKLQRTFSTAFYTHLLLSVIILLIMETGGMWFLFNKLNVPADRLEACVWVFQLSILTTIISITQVPYSAIIMAHEHMSIYAYVSIFEAVAKLIVCYLIAIADSDRLIIYAILIFFVQMIVALYYRYYCSSHFVESKLSRNFDRGIFKSMMTFSGWNIMANLTETLKHQGVLVLINMFFSPVVVAAQAIANQVVNAMMQFINNFRTAINPQIIKLYAAGDKDASKKLTLSTTVYCFELVLLLGLPALFVMDWLLHLWLVEVPEYAVVFTQWMIVCQIVGTFSASFYVPMLAANRIKSNSIAAIFLGLGQFVVLYVLLKMGFGVMWVPYLHLFLSTSFALLVKPYILYREIGYTLRELFSCYWNCAKVLILSLAISISVCHYLYCDLVGSLIKILVVGFSVFLSSYLFLDAETKQKLLFFVKQKIGFYKQ